MKIKIFKIAALILGAYFLTAGLYHGRPFFVPLAFAGIFAMLVLPVQNWLERHSFNSIVAATINLGIILGIFTGLFLLLTQQMESFIDDLPQLKKQLSTLLDHLKGWVQEKAGVSIEEQTQLISNKSDDLFNVASKGATGLLQRLWDISSNAFLIVVYIFCCLIYRKKFASFILKVTPDEKKELVEQVIRKTSKVARQYLSGRIVLILFLAVVYTVGLLIVGIEHAILFSILAALFSLIPYFGNLIGGFFPIATALLTGGGVADVIGVFIVFVIAQLIENYILEPLIIGTKVDLNPFFVILSIIAGGLLWGIPGMILANPILGVVKVLFDNIKPFRPYGWLIGDESESGVGRFFKRVLNK